MRLDAKLQKLELDDLQAKTFATLNIAPSSIITDAKIEQGQKSHVAKHTGQKKKLGDLHWVSNALKT